MGKISDMTPKGSAAGTENIAVDDSNVSKSILVSDIRDYVFSEIEGVTPLGSVDGNDFIMMLENGNTLKPTDIDFVSQHGIDTMWGKVEEASPDNTDVMLLKDGGSTEKTVTLASLAAYTLATNEASILNVTSLADGSGAISANDYMLVTQATVGKKVQISDITTLVYTGLIGHVTSRDAAGATADADILYCIQSGVAKQIPLSAITAHAGNVIDGSGTATNLAQWTDVNTLQAGPTIGIAADGFISGSDAVLPSTALVRGEMDEIINDATTMGAALVNADTILIDDGGAGTQKKSTMSRVYTYTVESIIPPAIDGTLATGANADFSPTKLVYDKTCSDSDGNDVIDLEDGTVLGFTFTLHLGTKAGSDEAVITPVTSLGYSTITLGTVAELATLQWQGAVVGWAILYTTGTIA